MSTVEKIAGTMLALVFVYLLVQNSRGASTVFDSLASGTSGVLKTLQGR
jgi:hypothetical protein